jgi:hypothetical protein
MGEWSWKTCQVAALPNQKKDDFSRHRNFKAAGLAVWQMLVATILSS